MSEIANLSDDIKEVAFVLAYSVRALETQIEMEKYLTEESKEAYFNKMHKDVMTVRDNYPQVFKIALMHSTDEAKEMYEHLLSEGSEEARAFVNDYLDNCRRLVKVALPDESSYVEFLQQSHSMLKENLGALIGVDIESKTKELFGE